MPKLFDNSFRSTLRSSCLLAKRRSRFGFLKGVEWLCQGSYTCARLCSLVFALPYDLAAADLRVDLLSSKDVVSFNSQETSAEDYSECCELNDISRIGEA